MYLLLSTSLVYLGLSRKWLYHKATICRVLASLGIREQRLTVDARQFALDDGINSNSDGWARRKAGAGLGFSVDCVYYLLFAHNNCWMEVMNIGHLRASAQRSINQIIQAAFYLPASMLRQGGEDL